MPVTTSFALTYHVYEPAALKVKLVPLCHDCCTPLSLTAYSTPWLRGAVTVDQVSVSGAEAQLLV